MTWRQSNVRLGRLARGVAEPVAQAGIADQRHIGVHGRVDVDRDELAGIAAIAVVAVAAVLMPSASSAPPPAAGRVGTRIAVSPWSTVSR